VRSAHVKAGPLITPSVTQKNVVLTYELMALVQIMDVAYVGQLLYPVP
jgi:hypothetical protein